MINQSKLAVNDLHYTKGPIFKILTGISNINYRRINDVKYTHTHYSYARIKESVRKKHFYIIIIIVMYNLNIV